MIAQVFESPDFHRLQKTILAFADEDINSSASDVLS
jgi:hypothetical protein